MELKTYKTKKIVSGDNLYIILDRYLPKLKEKDIVVITSKIISITQERLVRNDGKLTKLDLVKKEADLYLPKEYTKFGVQLTVKNNILIASAGIDESNGNKCFILWPENLQKTTENIWKYLKKKNGVENLGVVVTDSHLTPMRRGLTGLGISWCGFKPLKNYIGKKDIFGKILHVSKTNVVDGIAAAAVMAMGEGNEQTPLAVISDIKTLEFVDKPPTDGDIKEMVIGLEEDIYSGLLTAVTWTKGASFSSQSSRRQR